MNINRNDTAVVFIDPQNEVLSAKGLAWKFVGQSVTENKTVGGEFLESRRDRRLIEAATVLLPLIRSEIYGQFRSVNRFRQSASQPGMRTIAIKIMLEIP